MKKYAIIKNLLGLTTNLDDLFFFGFGRLHKSALIPNQKKLPFEYSFFVTNDDFFRECAHTYTFENYYANNRKTNTMYYSHKALLGEDYKVKIVKHLRGYDVYVNPNYYNNMKVRIDTVIQPGQLLFDLAVVDLLTHGYLTLHSAGISKHKKGTLLMAPPHAGKTTTAASFVTKEGFKLLSEDMHIIDSLHEIFPAPLISVGSNTFDSPNSKNIVAATLQKISRLAIYTPQTIPLPNTPTEDYYPFEHNLFAPTSRLTTVYILEKIGKKQKEKIVLLSKEDAVSRIENINLMQMGFHRDHTFHALHYFMHTPAIPELLLAHRKLIQKALTATNVYRVESFDFFNALKNHEA